MKHIATLDIGELRDVAIDEVTAVRRKQPGSTPFVASDRLGESAAGDALGVAFARLVPLGPDLHLFVARVEPAVHPEPPVTMRLA